MANEFKDVLRVEASETGISGLPTILRNKQVGFEADGDYRFAYKDSIGQMFYWTPDSQRLIYAEDVIYNDIRYSITNVDKALDYLLRDPLDLTSMISSTENSVKGQIVNSTSVSWTGVGYIDYLVLRDHVNLPDELATTANHYDYTSQGIGPTGMYTYALQAVNTFGESDFLSCYTYFKIHKFYGTSVSATPTESIVEAGTSVLSVDAATSITMSAVNITGDSKYVFYATPQSWGAVPNLYINGFKNLWNQTAITVTNAYGNIENYYVLTSPNPIVGNITLAASV